jgi:hypothetical protein
VKCKNGFPGNGNLNRVVIVLSAALLACSAWGYRSLEFDLADERAPGGPTLNAVCFVPGTTPTNTNCRYFAVGQNGWVYRLQTYGASIDDSTQLDPNYDLSGVSGFRWGSSTNNALVVAVGYRRDSISPTEPKWKGAIWISTDRGNNWNRVLENLIPQFPILDKAVPFLDVKVTSQSNIWVSCGYGFVFWSRDGGQTWSRTNQKPGGDQQLGWLWGVWASDVNTAWVCAVETTFVAVTHDGGNSWTTYAPFAGDSISYHDVCASPALGRVYFAGDKGKVVSAAMDGTDWQELDALGTEAEWVKGVCPYVSFYDITLFCAGTGGTINDARNPDVDILWFSRRYDFNAIAGGAWDPSGSDTFVTYVAVGTNRTIMRVRAKQDSYSLTVPQNPHQSQDEIFLVDIPSDDGWAVYGNWEPDSDYSNYWHVYIYPANDCDNYELSKTTDWGKRIYNLDYEYPMFPAPYDSMLTGLDITVTVTSEDEENEEVDVYEDDIVAEDNLVPRGSVPGFRGRLIPPYTVQLHWNDLPAGQELRLGGYRVCPEVFGLDWSWNHPSPNYRTSYAEDSRRYPRPCSVVYRVRALDRSFQYSEQWSKYCTLRLPVLTASAPTATAFNNGRHLARVLNTEWLHAVYEMDGKVMYSNSGDGGRHWVEPIELDMGTSPAVAINQFGWPWVVYLRGSDVCFKVRDYSGMWVGGVLFSGGEALMPGPPSLALAPPIAIPEMNYAVAAFPVYDPIMGTSGVRFVKFDRFQQGQSVIDPVPNFAMSDSFVTLSISPGEVMHCAWQRGPDILYSDALIPPGQWGGFNWFTPWCISQPEQVSKHPSLESFGEAVFAVWTDWATGEIFESKKPVWAPPVKWSLPMNVSATPDFSDFAQMSTSEAVSWQDMHQTGTWEILARIQGQLVAVSESPAANSEYGHVSAQLPDPYTATPLVVYSVWTEDLTPAQLHEVRCRRFDASSGSTTAALTVVGGGDTASTYCVQRDGTGSYGGHAFDYGIDSLQYELRYLDPGYSYRAEAMIYSSNRRVSTEAVYVDSSVRDSSSFSSRRPDTVSFLIPPGLGHDGEVGLELRKQSGEHAALGLLRLFAFEVVPQDSGGGGQQGSSLFDPSMGPALFAPAPNPFAHAVNVRYQVNAAGLTSVYVLDVAGRRVRTLVNIVLRPGAYSVSWNGRDDSEQQLPRGVYFVRLEAPSFSEARKLILTE